MSVKYDKDADALYVCLSEKPVASTRYVGDGRTIDFAEDGSVVGVEFFAVSEGIDPAGIPAEREVRHSLEGYSFKVVA